MGHLPIKVISVEELSAGQRTVSPSLAWKWMWWMWCTGVGLTILRREGASGFWRLFRGVKGAGGGGVGGGAGWSNNRCMFGRSRRRIIRSRSVIICYWKVVELFSLSEVHWINHDLDIWMNWGKQVPISYKSNVERTWLGTESLTASRPGEYTKHISADSQSQGSAWSLWIAFQINTFKLSGRDLESSPYQSAPP